jgi:8-amino-7-oxononanoate synthase
LRIVRTQPQRREKLLEKARHLRDWLLTRGLAIGGSESQIVPVIIGGTKPTMQATQQLRDRGLWVPAIRPPSVPEGEALLRISLSYAHTAQNIDQLLQAFAEIF